MLNLYTLQHERLAPVHGDVDLPQDAVWIDLLTPTGDEEARVERLLGIDIPTREEMAEIEESSRPPTAAPDRLVHPRPR